MKIKKKYFDKKHQQTKFKKDEKVLIYFPNRRNKMPETWTNAYFGPAKIIEKLNANLYRVKLPDTFRQNVQDISIDIIKRFYEDKYSS